VLHELLEPTGGLVRWTPSLDEPPPGPEIVGHAVALGAPADVDRPAVVLQRAFQQLDRVVVVLEADRPEKQAPMPRESAAADLR
jgi:hypothetical protein